MDFEFNKKWLNLIAELEGDTGEKLDVQSIIFMIGIQELNQGYVKLTKDQKIDIMHIAVCILLEPYGYYEYAGHDEDDWPHFDSKKNLPNLNPEDQELLMKKAILSYFDKID